MVKTPIRAATLLYREPTADPKAEGMLPGDIYEFTDPPFYEVDSITYEARSVLQCFRVKDTALNLEPVTRESWVRGHA
jgi:hypothetical protein